MVQKTYNTSQPRVDFNANDFDEILYQKGRRVWYEKSLQCPCKSQATNQQSNCKNCGGTGWVFLNGTQLRMLVTGVSSTSETKAWSEETKGMINVTCSDYVQLTHMDKITLLDANSIHHEVVFFNKLDSGDYIGFSAYAVKQLLYGGMFISTQQALQQLGTNKFVFGASNLVKLDPDFAATLTDTEISITLRYYHAPVYYIIELRRETMQSFKWENESEQQQHLPISAVARRGHYILDSPNFANNRLIDNSYTEIECGEIGSNYQDCHCTTIIVVPDNPGNNTVQRFPFTNMNSVTITHNLGREPDVTVFNQDGSEIVVDVEVLNTNTVQISFNVQLTGVVIIQ